MKAIQQPRLPADLDARELTSLHDGIVVEQCSLQSCALAGQRGSRVRFDAVRLAGAVLDGCGLPGLSWLDVACERGSLSLIECRGARLTRVVLQACRITGGKLTECVLESVRFTGCQMDYVLLSDARCKHVVFDGCQLRDADFRGADLTGTRFLQCELTGADFSGARMQGVELNTSTFERLTVGPGDVRGVIVNHTQAAALAKVFGIVVKD